MSTTSTLILLLCSLAIAESKHGVSPQKLELLPHPGITSAFDACEARVTPLSHKYFGAENKTAESFHVMMACAGLRGDPVSGRKGWKSYLPACPATAPSEIEWKQDPQKTVARYHPCADICFKKSASRSWAQIIHEERTELKKYDWYSLINGEERELLNRHYPGQQCCYAKNKLIANGAGAGTPDIIFRSPRRTPIRYRGTGLLRAALSHDRFDVTVIKERFPHWPKGWQDYFQLGWAPTLLPGTLRYSEHPEDAPCTSDTQPK